MCIVAIAADCKSVTLETPQVRLLLLPLLMADEEKHLMNHEAFVSGAE